MRTVRQNQARIDIFELLNEEKVLVVFDWPMKFLPQMYRESQQKWHGKRGKSWHISFVFRRIITFYNLKPLLTLSSRVLEIASQSCFDDAAHIANTHD